MLSPSFETSLKSVSLSFFLGEERDRHYFPTGHHHHHHHHPTHINFSDTSRGPTTKCHTFLETSHDPWLISELKYLELVIWRITIKIVTIHFIFFLIWNIASPWHFWWIMIMVIIIMMIMIMMIMMMMMISMMITMLMIIPNRLRHYSSTRTSGPFGPLVLVSYAFNSVKGSTDSQTGMLIWISNSQTWYWEKVSPNILICLKNTSFESETISFFKSRRVGYHWSFCVTL